MAKAKKQGLAVAEKAVATKEAKLQFSVREIKQHDGIGLIIVTTLAQKGADGRIWTSTIAGKGLTREAALSDLQANMARKPHAMADAAKRALELADAGVVSPESFLTGSVVLSPEKSKEISRRKILKDKIKAENLSITVPFGCTNEKLEELVAEAIKAKHAGGKEEF